MLVVRPIHVVLESNALLDILQLVIAPALALIGVWVGAKQATSAARATWQRDVKRDVYRRVMRSGYEAFHQAGEIKVAFERGGSSVTLDAEREKYRRLLAVLDAAVTEAEWSLAKAGHDEAVRLRDYAVRTVLPFIEQAVLGDVEWQEKNTEARKRLDSLSDAAKGELGL